VHNILFIGFIYIENTGLVLEYLKSQRHKTALSITATFSFPLSLELMIKCFRYILVSVLYFSILSYRTITIAEL